MTTRTSTRVKPFFHWIIPIYDDKINFSSTDKLEKKKIVTCLGDYKKQKWLICVGFPGFAVVAGSMEFKAI